MKNYRILENGELLWEGRAWGPNHAEEKCFWDEMPKGLCRYTLQVWEKVRCQWVNLYENTHMKNYYTLGPWYAENLIAQSIVVDSKGHAIADIARHETSTTEQSYADESIIANANLIAAAPDLLSALRWFADELPGIIRAHCPTGVPESVAKAHDAARAAISKAEGLK